MIFYKQFSVWSYRLQTVCLFLASCKAFFFVSCNESMSFLYFDIESVCKASEPHSSGLFSAYFVAYHAIGKHGPGDGRRSVECSAGEGHSC